MLQASAHHLGGWGQGAAMSTEQNSEQGSLSGEELNMSLPSLVMTVRYPLGPQLTSELFLGLGVSGTPMPRLGEPLAGSQLLWAKPADLVSRVRRVHL